MMSLSHFYSLSPASDKQLRPLDDLTISIPLPDNFLGEGEVFVLLRRAKHAGKALPPEPWEVISKNPDVLEGMVTFRAPDLGL